MTPYKLLPKQARHSHHVLLIKPTNSTLSLMYHAPSHKRQMLHYRHKLLSHCHQHRIFTIPHNLTIRLRILKSVNMRFANSLMRLTYRPIKLVIINYKSVNIKRVQESTADTNNLIS